MYNAVPPSNKLVISWYVVHLRQIKPLTERLGSRQTQYVLAFLSCEHTDGFAMDTVVHVGPMPDGKIIPAECQDFTLP